MVFVESLQGASRTVNYVTVKQGRGAFIVWKKYQRRVEVLAPRLDLDVYYFHYSWEERSTLLKALSYLPKSLATFRCLFRNKPALVFVQFPPTPALYCVALYCCLTGSRYVSDCHIAATNAHWLAWIGAKQLLTNGQMIVHSDHVKQQIASSMNIEPWVVRDGVAKKASIHRTKSSLLKALGLSPKRYVIVPWSFSADEPIPALAGAATLLPGTKFVVTWYMERLASARRMSLPSNVLLTGYLEIDDFNAVFANAGVALTLTSLEGIQLSGMQEAMAFGIPAVVSDLKTTRALYRRYPVYVANDPTSIARGVKYAFRNRQKLAARMSSLNSTSEKEFSAQLANLQRRLAVR